MVCACVPLLEYVVRAGTLTAQLSILQSVESGYRGSCDEFSSLGTRITILIHRLTQQ